MKNKRSPFLSRTRPRTFRRNMRSRRRSAAFSASSRLFDLNGEASRVSKRQNRAIIAADVRRFGHVIIRTEFSVHTPLPSNYLFIAYGLTTLRLTLVAFPFFVGRLASYSFWVTTASAVGDRLDLDSIESVSYVGIYFIASQLLLIPIIYIFTRIDWRAAFEEGRLRWFRAT